MAKMEYKYDKTRPVGNGNELNMMERTILSKIEKKSTTSLEGIYAFMVLYFIPKEEVYDFLNFTKDFSKRKDFKQYKDFFVPDTIAFHDGAYSYVYKIMNPLVAMAAVGDLEAKNMLLHMYKTYYKREYNQIKKFSEVTLLTIMDLLDVSEEELFFALQTDNVEPIVYENASFISRTITMCIFLNIKIDAGCGLLLGIMDTLHQSMYDTIAEKLKEPEALSAIELDKAYEISKNIIVEFGNQLSAEDVSYKDIKKYSNNNIWTEYVKYQEFIARALYDGGGFRDTYIRQHRSYSSDYMTDILNAMIHTIAILKNMEEDANTGIENVKLNDSAETLRNIAPYTALYQVVKCFTDDLQCAEDVCNILQDTYGEIEDQRLFPDKLQPATKSEGKQEINRGKSNDKVTEFERLAFEREIMELKGKLRNKEQDISHLHHELKKQKENCMLQEKQISDLQSKQDELIHLRDYVYSLTEQSNSAENSGNTELTIKEKEQFLKSKNIVVIGGHPNWIKNIKPEFTNWLFVEPGPNSTNNVKLIDNADYTVFFTDIIKHSVYGKYIARCRELHLKYGYLHSINREKMIDTLYMELNK